MLLFNKSAVSMRRCTPLRAETSNVTRWSSTFEILKFYQLLRSTIPNVDHKNVFRLLSDPGDDLKVDIITKRLSNFESDT